MFASLDPMQTPVSQGMINPLAIWLSFWISFPYLPVTFFLVLGICSLESLPKIQILCASTCFMFTI